MNIEFTQKGILIATVIKGQRIKRLYQGYTKKEAMADFKTYCLNYAYCN